MWIGNIPDFIESFVSFAIVCGPELVGRVEVLVVL